MKRKIAMLILAGMILPVLASGATVAEPSANTTISLYYNTGNSTRETACLLLEEAIEALDIDGDGVSGDIEIIVENLAWADYLDQLGDRDKIAAYVLGWGPDYADPDDYIVPFVGGIHGTYAYWNSYNNSDINGWIDEAARTSDKEARAVLYGQIEDQAAADVAFVPLYQANDIRVERYEVKGYVYNPMTTSGNDLFYLLSKNASTGTNTSTLVKESFGGPQYLDPGIGYESAGGEIIQNIYETLITYKDFWKPDEFMPLLASAMPVWSPAGDHCNISLRDDVTFHDGTQFNASSVKYSFDRAVLINDPDGPNWLWGGFAKGGPAYMDLSVNATDADVMTFINGPDGVANTPDQFVTIINNTAVQISLDFPYVPFESIMAYTMAAILSPTYDMTNLAGMGDEPMNMTKSMLLQANADPGYMANHTCGTGPYELVEWEHLSHVEMAAYGGYYGAAPSITNVTVVRNDETGSRVLSIATGTADIITMNAAENKLVSYESGDFDTWGSLDNEVYAGVNVTVGLPSWSVVSLFMNHALEPFDDVNARLGIAYAFPYDTFIQSALRGHGIPQHGTIPSGMFGHIDAFPYETNYTKAVEYFRAAGVGMPEGTSTTTTTTTTGETTTTTEPETTVAGFELFFVAVSAGVLIGLRKRKN